MTRNGQVVSGTQDVSRRTKVLACCCHTIGFFVYGRDSYWFKHWLFLGRGRRWPLMDRGFAKGPVVSQQRPLGQVCLICCQSFWPIRISDVYADILCLDGTYLTTGTLRGLRLQVVQGQRRYLDGRWARWPLAHTVWPVVGEISKNLENNVNDTVTTHRLLMNNQITQTMHSFATNYWVMLKWGCDDLWQK